MGDFEFIYYYFSVLVLSLVVYNIINSIFLKNLLKKFGLFKISRRDYYECGFKPQNQLPIRVPIQFLLISIFFLLYDIELIFVVPFVSGITFLGFYDLLLIIFFFLLLFFSLVVDFDRHALYWQY